MYLKEHIQPGTISMSNPTPPEALRRIEECRNLKSTELDLSSCGLTEIPSELADLVWLEKVNISRNQISEIENLDSLSSLKILTAIRQPKGLHRHQRNPTQQRRGYSRRHQYRRPETHQARQINLTSTGYDEPETPLSIYFLLPQGPGFQG